MKHDDEARAAILATALGQPHRRGSDDPRLECPLGRLCLSAGFPGDLYGAGVRYREVVLEARQALGLPNPGYQAGSSGYTEGMDDAAAAKRARQTRERQNESDAVLCRVARTLPSLMKNLCVLEIEPNHSNYSILRRGLVALHALYSVGRKKNG